VTLAVKKRKKRYSAPECHSASAMIPIGSPAASVTGPTVWESTTRLMPRVATTTPPMSSADSRRCSDASGNERGSHCLVSFRRIAGDRSTTTNTSVVQNAMCRAAISTATIALPATAPGVSSLRTRTMPTTSRIGGTVDSSTVSTRV
jgi:hypothetical protein